MNVVVIGGTGHIGSFLVPQLVDDGHKVVVVSRGKRPVPKEGPWAKITYLEQEYKRGDETWQKFIASLEA